MNKVIFVRAGESSKTPERVKRLRSDAADYIEILHPPAELAPNACDTWLNTVAESVDVLVVCVAGLSDNGHEAPAAPAEAGPGAAASHPSRYPIVTADQRSTLPDTLTTLVAMSTAAEAPHLPEDLKPFRSFDLSSDDGYDALLCRLVHEPVTPQPSRSESGSKKWEAGTGAFRIVMGLVATIVGNQDSMRDYLVANLGDAAWIVHYIMVATVVILILTGLAALLRTAFDFARPLIHEGVGTMLHARWRLIAFVVPALLSLAFAANYFPHALSVDNTVEEHEHELARRLIESQMGSGAFREHHDQGVGQAWMSAQALAGLLSTLPKAISPADYGRAFSFIDRTRIGRFNFSPDTSQEIAAHLQSVIGPIDVARLPAQIPTVAFGYDMLALLAGRVDLPTREVGWLDSQKDRLFGGVLSNEGWGYFEQFDWGVTEINAWVGVALAQALRVKATVPFSPGGEARAKDRLRSVVATLRTRQIPGLGGFSPIADVSRLEFVRTYSTVMALWAMSEASALEPSIFDDDEMSDIKRTMRDAVSWLGRTALPDGWKVNPGNPTGAAPFLGLTAQTLFVLDRARIPFDQTSEEKFATVRRHLVDDSNTWVRRAVDANDRTHDADRYMFPTTFVTEGSTFLWYPWTLALMRSIATDTRADRADIAQRGAKLFPRLRARAGEFGDFAVGKSEFNYVAAEGLIGFGWPVGPN